MGRIIKYNPETKQYELRMMNKYLRYNNPNAINYVNAYCSEFRPKPVNATSISEENANWEKLGIPEGDRL